MSGNCKVALALGILSLSACAQSERTGNQRPPDGDIDRDLSAQPAADLSVAPVADLSIACLVPLEGEFCPPVIYASPSGNDFNGGESPADPVRSLPVAIARALKCQGAPCPIAVAAGSYDAQVVLADGIQLLGGFNANFSARDPAANVVTISAQSSTDPRTMVADGLVQPTTVDGVTILGPALTSGDGRASFALWAHATRQALVISRATITGGTGANGAVGSAGVDLTCGTTAASGGVAFDCGASTGALGTAAGDPAMAGGAGQGGSSNCPSACPLVGTDGISDGSPGVAGGNGMDGAGGSAAADGYGSFVAGVWSGSSGGPASRGLNGTGGGGGGSGGTKRIRACFSCGTLLGGRGGDGAPGGCGGGPGGPGGAGGGAFAVLLQDADVSFTNVQVQGGTGGNGGAGGSGRAGAMGGQTTNSGQGAAASSECGLITYDSGAGGPGGLGGNGGAGGGGAGGAGGPAITVVTAGNSTFTMSGTVNVTPGTGGTGGAGGTSAGKSGQAGINGPIAADRAY